jgi:GT2 family glycosyltransferase
MSNTRLFFSLVLYKHTLQSINPLLRSLDLLSYYTPDISLLLSVYDGSPASFPSPSKIQISALLPLVDVRLQKGVNIGFGRANNHNFQLSCLSPSDIFVVVNPDISFVPDNFFPLVDWISSHPECVCVAPLVLLKDGSIQYSAKHDPTVLSLLLGRFSFLKLLSCFRRYDSWHRNLSRDYRSEIIGSTYLSGCFLLIPAWAYQSVGGFCPKYFLHVEDADIVRRLSLLGNTVHNPTGAVVHGWARGSHFSPLQVLSLLRSFIIYCSIWGFRFA